MTPPSASELPLPGPVRVTWDRELSEELDRRLAGPPGERLVSVTELVEPRPAFHRAVHPIPPTEERRRRIEAGRQWHERLERAVAAASHREIRVLREGVVGRIDILDDRPTEIKSTGRLPDPERLAEERPQYLDQLGMYCALVDRPEGRLVLLGTAEVGPFELRVLDGRFGGLDEIRARMQELARRFREALRRGDPSELPRCPWLGRGCEYQDAGVCGCTGAEPEGVAATAGLVVELRNDAAVAERLAQRLREPSPRAGAEPLQRYRELAYPRRAFFDRRAPPAAGADGSGPVRPAEPSLYQRLREVLESGAPGELAREVPAGDVPEEPVLMFRSDPLLLKTSRARWPTAAEEIPRRQPHYLLELGLRCAALHRPDGWLIVAHERPDPPGTPVRAHRVRFDPLAPWERLLAERAAALRDALARGDPEGLARCPEWMVASCPYRSECGEAPALAPDEARRQR
jgi:PD-(D/E)XK nuclease superfamily